MTQSQNRGESITLNIPERSDWQCWVTGDVMYRPTKGSEPNAFHRLMQRIAFGFRFTCGQNLGMAGGVRRYKNRAFQHRWATKVTRHNTIARITLAAMAAAVLWLILMGPPA